MKLSTFHSFMISDAKETAQDHLLEGQRRGGSHDQAIKDELALIKHADQLGFDTAWLREHHFTDYGFLSNTMILAANAAAVTEQIRLGTAVIVLPLHHPIRVAEDVALVDLLSDGRVDIGLSRGYQSIEFNTLGVPLSEARERTDEGIEILKALWTNDPAGHSGKHWNFDPVRTQPRPVQTPHPPLYYASISEESIVHYAKQGLPFIIDPTLRISEVKRLAALWHEVAHEHGHDTTDAELTTLRYVWLDETDEAAHEEVRRAPKVTFLGTPKAIQPVEKDGSYAKGYEYWKKGEWHGRNLDHYADDHDWDDKWIAGAPERVIGQFRELSDAGIKNVCCIFGLSATPAPRDVVAERMGQFAREVMPDIKALGPTVVTSAP